MKLKRRRADHGDDGGADADFVRHRENNGHED
jgi:hypothetical protein